MGCCASSPAGPLNALSQQNIKILAQIGEGNFSKVHICEKYGEKFACKICDPATDDKDLYIEALRDEIKALKCVKGHPNIVRLHLVEEVSGIFYLVMQFLNGGDLCDYVMRKQSLNEHEASRIVLQVARALRHCHNNGVVHRDLKPENLMIHTAPGTGELQVVLCDFGFAKELKKNNLGSYHPENIFRGTPGYVPPEMMMAKPYRFEVDMWSFGIGK
jgi:5'-AMP-activated protein kinase catalytic alpha subunit